MGRSRRLYVPLAAVLLAGAPAVANPAGEASPPSYRQEDCHEVVAFFSADVATVRPHVPDRFRLATDGAGEHAVVFLHASRCERLSVDGGPRSTLTRAALGIEIQPPNARVPSGSSVSQLDLYVLFFATDSRELTRWYRAGTGLGSKAVFTDRLVYTQPPLFHFEADSPSPFTIDAVAGGSAVPLEFDVAWWAEKDGGAVMLRNLPYTLLVGATEGTVTPGEGSLMERLLGEGPRRITTSDCHEEIECAVSNLIPGATTVKEFVPCGSTCYPEEGT